jgi:hypothetical protein
MKILVIAVVAVLGIAVNLLLLWLVISVTSSGIKAGIGNCDEVYPVDNYLLTEMFCEDKKTDQTVVPTK